MAETITTTRGGRRAGAGRKVATHTLETEAAKKRIAELVNAEIEPLVQAQIKIAKKGNTKAFDSLMDRAHGRPAQTIEHTGDVKLLVDF